jgi:transcription initiation factor IIE alpha subunit
MDKKEWDALYVSHQNWKEFVAELINNKQITDTEIVEQIQLEISEIDRLLVKIRDENTHC